MIINKIWYNLVNSKFKCYYISYSIDKYQKYTFRINIFLSIVSLSSVSAWIIWDFLPWLWAIIIASSNILIAIKPILHYEKKIKELNEKLFTLENIEIEYEKLFFELKSGLIDDKKGAELFFNIYEKQIKTLRTSDELLLKLDMKIKERADKETKRYIYNNYQTKSE